MNVEQKEFAEIIRSSGDSLLAIINDILDFSKIEAGRLELNMQPLDLECFVGNAIASFAKPANEKRLKLAYSIDSDVPKSIIADINRLRQILVNLFSNAIKFTSKGHITLKVSIQKIETIDDSTNDSINDSENICLLFAVKDTGIGIPKDAYDRLFKPFSQVDSSTTRKYGGTGLGLVICTRLTQLMGGKMFLESELNVGSTFSFTIMTKPVATANNLDSSENSTDESSSSADILKKSLIFDEDFSKKYPLNILLAEDNLLNQKVATRFLNRLGYDIDVANNGKEAINSLRQKNYDLILMDIHMPEMDGLEATKQIIIEFPNYPWIIALTANALEGDRDICLAAGMKDYVSKPIQVQELTKALEKAYSALH
jgi:CheY-like chemotaxis protein